MADSLAKDQEVTEPFFAGRDLTQGDRDPELVAEGFPLLDDALSGFDGFAGFGSMGRLQCSAEVSRETVSLESRSIFQPPAWG